MRQAWSASYQLIFWVVTAVCVAVAMGLWLFFRPQLPPVVPWFYSLPWGESQLVGKNQLLLAPALVLTSAGVCGVGAWFIRSQVLAGMVLTGAVAFQIVVTVALLRVLLIVV